MSSEAALSAGGVFGMLARADSVLASRAAYAAEMQQVFCPDPSGKDTVCGSCLDEVFSVSGRLRLDLTCPGRLVRVVGPRGRQARSSGQAASSYAKSLTLRPRPHVRFRPREPELRSYVAVINKSIRRTQKDVRTVRRPTMLTASHSQRQASIQPQRGCVTWTRSAIRGQES